MSTTPTPIEPTPQPEKKLAAPAPREIRVVHDDGPVAHLLDSARFEHMFRIATVMAGASLIPDHMWKDKNGNLPPEMVKANCFLVVNQALRWGFDPFAVVPETYVVGGKLGFQGKLVAAVINANANLSSRLNYMFSGEKGKDNLTVEVSGTIKGEEQPRTITLSVGEAKTDNKMWTKDPEQKLVYSGATKWARRHCPEVILGVLTDDDVDRIAAEAPALPRAKVPVEEKVVLGKDAVPESEFKNATGASLLPISTDQEVALKEKHAAQLTEIMELMQKTASDPWS